MKKRSFLRIQFIEIFHGLRGCFPTASVLSKPGKASIVWCRSCPRTFLSKARAPSSSVEPLAWPPLTHASVRNAAGRQAHAPEPGRRFFVDAMQFPSRRSFIVNANQVHRRRLHAERQLVVRQINDLRRGISQMRAGAESFRELALWNWHDFRSLGLW